MIQFLTGIHDRKPLEFSLWFSNRHETTLPLVTSIKTLSMYTYNKVHQMINEAWEGRKRTELSGSRVEEAIE